MFVFSRMENGILVHQHLHLSSLNLSQSEAEGGRGFTDCGRARLPACTSYKESVSTAGAGYLRPALSKKKHSGTKTEGPQVQTRQGLACLVQRKSRFHPFRSFCPVSLEARLCASGCLCFLAATDVN